ncbi:PadR family transcriptional regulator [Arthrobacter sp. Br18]|uniref:PadR family transcriptional regulator n=1 Tax=Arthrobacter sp. Br18 TaxID=1312954 RepID=UPI00047D5452|nr:PadR family transcriptional regulator [Arthrobacter sp. Br18]
MGRASTFTTGDLTDTGVYVLLSLLEPRHGYAIGQFVAETTDGAVVLGPATLYTTLRKLTEAHLIEEIGSSDTRRVYHLTRGGREVLERNIDRRRRLVGLATTLMEAR